MLSPATLLDFFCIVWTCVGFIVKACVYCGSVDRSAHAVEVYLHVFCGCRYCNFVVVWCVVCACHRWLRSKLNHLWREWGRGDVGTWLTCLVLLSVLLMWHFLLCSSLISNFLVFFYKLVFSARFPVWTVPRKLHSGCALLVVRAPEKLDLALHSFCCGAKCREVCKISANKWKF